MHASMPCLRASQPRAIPAGKHQERRERPGQNDHRQCRQHKHANDNRGEPRAILDVRRIAEPRDGHGDEEREQDEPVDDHERVYHATSDCP